MNTMTRINLRELGRINKTLDALRIISTQLHRQDENACNYGLSARQETRVANLEDAAEALAQELGYHAYHQSDPRGASLYLIDDTMNDTNYSQGLCIWMDEHAYNRYLARTGGGVSEAADRPHGLYWTDCLRSTELRRARGWHNFESKPVIRKEEYRTPYMTQRKKQGNLRVNAVGNIRGGIELELSPWRKYVETRPVEGQGAERMEQSQVILNRIIDLIWEREGELPHLDMEWYETTLTEVNKMLATHV